MMNVNFNPVKQTSQQKPAFGVKYGFREKDVHQLGLYLSGENSYSIRKKEFFTALVDFMERHNADESLHKGVLDAKAAILDVTPVGCSDKMQINAGVSEDGNPYKMFYANREYTGKLKQVKKLFKEINSQIISTRLGVNVEQKLPKAAKSGDGTLKPTLMERIRALSDESF